MAHEDTPSSVMYSILKGLKVSNKDAAPSFFLLPKSMQKAPARSLEERTFLSRLTHAEPGTFPESSFANLTQAAQRCAPAS